MRIHGHDVVPHAREEFHARVGGSDFDDERSFSKQVLDHERADCTVAGQREFAQLACGEQLRERLGLLRSLKSLICMERSVPAALLSIQID